MRVIFDFHLASKENHVNQDVIARIEAAQQAFQDWAAQNPELAEAAKADLLSLGGGEEHDLGAPSSGRDFGLVKLDLAAMVGWRTTCGNEPNECFSSQAVRDFLRAHGTDFILALNNNGDEEGTLAVRSAVANLSWDDAEAFSELVYDAGGTLRPEDGGELYAREDWFSFESE